VTFAKTLETQGKTDGGYQSPRPKPTFKVITTAAKTAQQTMEQRGYNMVENMRMWETPIKIEFNLNRSVVEFNVRDKITELLQLMQEVDNTLKVKPAAPVTREWVTLEALPEEKEFTDQFRLKEFLYRNHRKVYLHMTVVTTLPMNRIKYAQRVKDYIFNQNIWVKLDRFNAKIESSPGYITMVHPKLINRDGFTEELIMAITQVKREFDAQEKKDSAVDRRNDRKTDIPPLLENLEPTLLD